MTDQRKRNTALSLAREIRAFCAAHADVQQRDRYARYFREGYDAWGVPDEAMRPQRDLWFERNQDLGLAGFLALGDELFRSGKYEEAMIAINLVSRLKDRFSPATLKRFARWLDTGVRNWAQCDVMCGELLSGFLLNDKVRLEALADWRAAKSRWRRRAVPVTLIPAVKKAAKVSPYLDFVEPMMPDSERVVHQGLGWFLREAWKLQPKPVEKLLLRWRDTAARLIFQYAGEKMTPEQKQRFRAKAR